MFILALGELTSLLDGVAQKGESTVEEFACSMCGAVRWCMPTRRAGERMGKAATFGQCPLQAYASIDTTGVAAPATWRKN